MANINTKDSCLARDPVQDNYPSEIKVNIKTGLACFGVIQLIIATFILGESYIINVPFLANIGSCNPPPPSLPPFYIAKLSLQLPLAE